MNLLIGTQSLPSTISNPFQMEFVTDVYVRYTQNTFSKKWYAYGNVEFINNKTKGEQRFEGETFDEVVLKIKSFLQELKTNQ